MRRSTLKPTAMALSAVALSALTLTTPAKADFEAQSVQSFRTADSNGDELLSLTEFRAFIESMANAGAPVSRRIHNLGAYRLAFLRVDSNRDGLATPEELLSASSEN